MPRRKGEAIRLDDERAVVKHTRRARPADGALHELHDEVRHDECRQRAARGRAQRTVRAERHHRARNAERHAAQMREDGPESRAGRDALSKMDQRTNSSRSRASSRSRSRLACMSGHRAGRFVRPGEDFAKHRAFER